MTVLYGLIPGHGQAFIRMQATATRIAAIFTAEPRAA
jgi:hypothetical protein